MEIIDVLIPLVGGACMLFAPVRPMAECETAEQVAKRRKTVRQAGGALVFVGCALLVMKLASPA